MADWIDGFIQGVGDSVQTVVNGVVEVAGAVVNSVVETTEAIAEGVGGVLGWVVRGVGYLAAGIAGAAVILVGGAFAAVFAAIGLGLILLATLLKAVFWVVDLIGLGFELARRKIGHFFEGGVETDIDPETWRPCYHYHPRTGWMSDPNGLLLHLGTFHLYYQHVPLANEGADPGVDLGRIVWGHATSSDLVNWTELAPALAPNPGLGVPLSGSAVVDVDNDSGLCTAGSGCIVAAFTNLRFFLFQSQSLAASADGASLTPFAANPVLSEPHFHFRDPRLVRLDETEDPWLMILASKDHLRFYRSPDFKAWRRVSSFSGDAGVLLPIWECPDLFQLNAPGGGTAWVLVFSIMEHGTFYFVGDFTGTTFMPSRSPARRLDHGPDLYATQSWSGLPRRRVVAAWMSNWAYAERLPTRPWRGHLSVPRDLRLLDADGEVLVAQRPVEALAALRGPALVARAGEALEGLRDFGSQGTALDIELDLELGTAVEVRLSVRVGAEEATTVFWRADELVLDRRQSGLAIHSSFPRLYPAPLALGPAALRLRTLVDRSSIEVFGGDDRGGDGRACLSALIFPAPESDGLTLEAVGGVARIVTFNVYPLPNLFD